MLGTCHSVDTMMPNAAHLVEPGGLNAVVVDHQQERIRSWHFAGQRAMPDSTDGTRTANVSEERHALTTGVTERSGNRTIYGQLATRLGLRADLAIAITVVMAILAERHHRADYYVLCVPGTQETA